MRTCKYLLVAATLLALGASPALANQPGTIKFYMGAASIQTDSTSLSFVDPLEDATVGIEVDNASSMTIGLTYFFNQNWAVDLLAALPFEHDVKAFVSSDEESGAAKIGSVKHLPPTLSVQYYFTTEGDFDPYVGLGMNYTHFYDETLVSDLVDEGIWDLCLDSSFGAAAQVGADWAMDDKWLVNFDVRFIDIEADATLEGPAFVDFGEEVSIGTINIDPWVYSINLGYRFE